MIDFAFRFLVFFLVSFSVIAQNYPSKSIKIIVPFPVGGIAGIYFERLAAGNAGDVEPVGEGVSEMRIDYGPRYRVYFKKQGREVVILLRHR